MKILQLLIILIIGMISFPISAQSSCDKLFANGVKYQQTMTIASQNKAITYFEKAKVCYDSKTKKDLCDQQITACRNIIVQLKKKAKNDADATSAPIIVTDTLATMVTDNEVNPNPNDIMLSIDCVYLRFKGKGEEFKKATVICNYPDWEIVEKPDWVKCSKNDGEIVVEALKNSTKEERSGSIIIKCGEKMATLTIIQEKSKKFGVL